jgi:hypothetical protein
VTATASAHASIVSDGPAAGCRALDIRVSSGLDIRLLPDRGLDIGEAWFRGTPLAWISAVGETGPLPQPRGTDWNDAFGGGLVTTCGLRNVGAPSEGHGQHGTYSHLRAREVRVEHAGDEVVARARIVDASAIGHRLEVEREVRTRVGAAHVTITDVTTNLGPDTEAVPLLYHVNLGPPVWSDGARVEVDSREVVPRDDDARAGLSTWGRAPGLEPGAAERVFEHRRAIGCLAPFLHVREIERHHGDAAVGQAFRIAGDERMKLSRSGAVREHQERIQIAIRCRRVKRGSDSSFRISRELERDRTHTRSI